MLVEKFNYPKLTRKQENGKRKYTLDGEDYDPVPSVTTILDKTADKTFLIEWRNRVGEEEANRQTKQATGLGTLVHNGLEKYLLGAPDWDITGTNMVHIMAKKILDNIVEKGLVNMNEIWGMEVGLFAPGLYAGTADLLGVHENKESVVDFKTAKKIKQKDHITDYFLQGCAYALAHNEQFGTDMRKVVIMMGDREGRYKEFSIEGREFDNFAEMWARRVEDYYQKFGF